MLEFTGKKALIVEDDDDIRGLLEIVLSQMGFHVSSASTGARGLELARSENPELITLDVGLPDTNGIEVLRTLRTFSQERIVLLTSRGQQSDIDAGIEAGATAYLLKPFKPGSLRQELAAILGK
ncbi:response regulator transcription factor [Arthrobacter sp. GMC3]|uniref:response regulator transcription factor n=1 Tax=Arthrobacter sp. GMC3 TaxID=2058894 RepID=UPI000CE5713B|nr:response regulator [Arthrobacter sp. GMC3]